MYKLEICTSSLVSAVHAEQGRADRVEVCENLAVGGVTPSVEFVKEVLAKTKIEAHILIRPRSGDFVFSNKEIDQMLLSVHAFKEMGVKGVVIGALDRYANLDLSAIKALMQAAEGLQITFHRALDISSEPGKLLKKLVDFGFNRVLTSGQQPTALEGIRLLEEMQNQVGNHIDIMAGGGVNSANIQQIAIETGLKNFHSSARKSKASGSLLLKDQFGISIKPPDVEKSEDADLEEVKGMSHFCKSHGTSNR